VEEHTLTEGTLTKRVKELLEDPVTGLEMGKRIKESFACPDANERIYECLMGLIASR
jgi:hypothetical protein